ncbi:hypothetical protein A5680_16365 [Mycobacterium sp. E2989]|nr:hypothetical protein A5702_09855 [Mycobacterium sp. E3339]OBH81265.1 hypothetical protein A5680_16365 [Mycobacterium sp. E2989]
MGLHIIEFRNPHPAPSPFRNCKGFDNNTQLHSHRRRDHGAQKGELSSSTSVDHPGDLAANLTWQRRGRSSG